MKKEPLRLPDYLSHICQAIERVNSYVKVLDKEEWLRNTMVQDAVIRNIEIIGEASHKVQTLHQDFAKQNADFPWDDAYWMRNVLSHGYFQVDLDLVWETVTKDLPVFLEKIRSIRPPIGRADDDS
jgi:uncharacterized protein with HEPN domain